MAYSNYYPNKIVKIAHPQQATIANIGDMPNAQPEYDEYYYDPMSMAYRKIENQHEIERLKNELNKKKDKVKSLIAYYYNR